MSEGMVRRTQAFTIRTKLTSPVVTESSDLTDKYVQSWSMDTCKVQHKLSDQVSLCLGQSHVCATGCLKTQETPDTFWQGERTTGGHLKRSTVCPSATSRSVRKISISNSTEPHTLNINPKFWNFNNNNISTVNTEMPCVERAGCEYENRSHVKVLLHNDEGCIRNKQTSEHTVKHNHKAEALIHGELSSLTDSSNVHKGSMRDSEKVLKMLQRELNDFDNTLIPLNQMGAQLICKQHPTSGLVRKRMSKVREQWSTLTHTATHQTKVLGGTQSLQEFNKKIDQLETWIKQKQEEEKSLAGLLGKQTDKLELTRRILDLKQEEQMYKNLLEEINRLAVKLEKRWKGEGKSISSRKKHINKMWLKFQSILKDYQEHLQLALEVSSFYQQADNVISSINNMRKLLCVADGSVNRGSGEIRGIASQIMVLDITASQLSTLHPALAARFGQKQGEVKDSWHLLQSIVRNKTAVWLPSLSSASSEDSEFLNQSREPHNSAQGIKPYRIYGKEVKEEQNRLKGITAVKVLQALGNLESWLEALELSIRQTSLVGHRHSVRERQSCLLQREMETHSMKLHSLRQEVEALHSHRHLHTRMLHMRIGEVEKKLSNLQTALTQQSSEIKDTHMLMEFLESLELEERQYGTLGQSDLVSVSSLLPLPSISHCKPLMESLGDPMEKLREAVEMLNDTAWERGCSQSRRVNDQSIQELRNKHAKVSAQVEVCLQHCAELAVEVIEIENEMALQCEPQHCSLESLQDQQEKTETDYEALKEDVEAMKTLFAQMADQGPEGLDALGSEVQVTLQVWDELGKSIDENQNRILHCGQLHHFFRNYLTIISWTEETRSHIFSEGTLLQGSLTEFLDHQIEQKFLEYDLLATSGKKLLDEKHHLAKTIEERTGELRSMLGWILVHWRAQKKQWLDRKITEKLDNDDSRSELDLEISVEDKKKRAGCSATVPADHQDNKGHAEHKTVKDISSIDSERQCAPVKCDSPYLMLKEPSLGATVNLILSFTNPENSQLLVEQQEQEKIVESSSETVDRCSEPHSSLYKSFWKGFQERFSSLKRKKKLYGHNAEESRMSEFVSLEGTLDRKLKLLPGGRKAPCGTWGSYHAVLKRQTLTFYQDKKDTVRNSVTSGVLNLRGAQCTPAPDDTKQPYSFCLRLLDGSEYLLNALSHLLLKKWILGIQANAVNSCRVVEQLEQGLPFSRSPNQDSTEKPSHSITSAVNQGLQPKTLPPTGKGQDSNSSYSVTLFIEDGKRSSVCSSATLTSSSYRQKSFSEIPLKSCASHPHAHSKSVFRKLFGKD